MTRRRNLLTTILTTNKLTYVPTRGRSLGNSKRSKDTKKKGNPELILDFELSKRPHVLKKKLKEKLPQNHKKPNFTLAPSTKH